MEEAIDFSFINEGYRAYKSPKKVCAACPSLAKCTESKDHQKMVTRHIWEEEVKEADHLRHHEEVKPIYAKLKEKIERVFTDTKEKHGMRWTTLRGLKKLSMQAMLTFAAMNLKENGQLDLARSQNALTSGLVEVTVLSNGLKIT